MDADLHSVNLRLAYKGDRYYLQGPDIYNAVTRIISERNPNIEFNRIKMVFHKLARNQCRMTFGNHSLLGKMPKDINTEVRFISPLSDIIGWLVETDEHIIDRNPFPEENIVKQTSIDGNIATIEGEVQFTPIEILVAMTKHLHIILYPAKAGKWIVTRLDLNRLLTIYDASKFKVEIEKNLNNRLTKGSIHSGKEMLGYIYFSLATL
jgi:hypothetical protein